MIGDHVEGFIWGGIISGMAGFGDGKVGEGMRISICFKPQDVGWELQAVSWKP